MRSILKSILTALFIFSLFICGIFITDNWLSEQSYYALIKQIKNAAEHCFALEGQYPPNLSYLEENYGILIDHRRFTVDYRRTDSDRMPEVRVKVNEEGAWA